MKQAGKSSNVFPSRLSVLAIACQLACVSIAYAQSTESTEMASSQQVNITGKKVGMGLMVQENAPKARSTINAEELAKQRPTGNAYEALELMPAVNSYNYDATGLFGGGLTLRGFNSDQIGATINGVPVNDSGNFAVYPQEYVDQENTCTQFVTQGSTDVDSPQIGATGGNFGITTCDPSKERAIRVMQTVGQLNLTKTFVRYNSGMLSDGKSRFFISGSHAQSDKWKGAGQAKRDHVDIGFRTDFDRFNSINAVFLYNTSPNNVIYAPTLAELQKNGYNYDFATTFTGHVKPTKDVADKDTDARNGAVYYDLAHNPFENIITSVTGKMRLGENTDVKVIPYYWYGFGTGGTQQRVQTENKFFDKASGTNTGKMDLNGDGDALDTVIIASSGFTRTNRPGVTASLSHSIDNHQILGGFWYERATHEQFSPMVAVDNNGNPADIWLKENRILRADGTEAQSSRNYKTISTAYQFFLQDTISLLNDKLSINVGVRVPTMKRDFTNYANEGALIDYTISKEYKEVLPQFGARYQIDNNNQVFASLAKNMKAPPNFIYSNLPVKNIVNGVGTLPVDVKAETSYNLDLGYRLQSDALTAQFTVYVVDFKNRQANAYDKDTDTNSLTNLDRVKTKGFEIELGNTPVNGFSFYGSLGYAQSEISGDVKSSGPGKDPLTGATKNMTVNLPTNGKEMTLTPDWKAGMSAQYETPVWYARLKAKYTSSQWATMTNDEKVPAYTLFGLDAGYQLPNTSWMKKPTIRFSISNLFNKEYRNPSSFNVTNALPYTEKGVVANARTVSYYLGSPRFASVTLSADF